MPQARLVMEYVQHKPSYAKSLHFGFSTRVSRLARHLISKKCDVPAGSRSDVGREAPYQANHAQSEGSGHACG
jgi:hypothetical protein